MQILIKPHLHILIVGAGGIGCEVIKNLYKTNNTLTILDYDIISQSNLNRQFCYRITDVGKHKVEVIQKYFKSLNQNLQLNIEIDNLYHYDSLYFSQFDILISALDNNQARCYLNQMAIDNNIPMIDAGIAGYNGQQQCFVRHISECRMCRPKITEEVNLAVCSLRGKPERNIHCIHFALKLYNQIGNIHKNFHSKSQQKQKQKEAAKWSNLQKYFPFTFQSQSNQKFQQRCINFFNYLFHNSIESMNIQNTTIINYKQIKIQQLFEKLQINIKNSNQCRVCLIDILKQPQNDSILHEVALPVQFYSLIFMQCLQNLLSAQQFQPYDKDIFEHSALIFSITNLRIYNFLHTPNSKLKHMSYYECKDLSGKIIPAIASTNSIAAALQVLTISNLLKTNNKMTENMDQKRPKYMSIKGIDKKYKVDAYLAQKPKPGCPSCSYLYNYVEIYVNTEEVTWGKLQQFLASNFDESLKRRDMRSGQYILIRNSTSRPFHSNKNKLINFHSKLIHISKLDHKSKVIIIKYLPLIFPSNLMLQNQIWRSQYHTIWKFILIHSQAEKQIKLKKDFNKQEYTIKVQNTLKQLKTKYQHCKQIVEQIQTHKPLIIEKSQKMQ